MGLKEISIYNIILYICNIYPTGTFSVYVDQPDLLPDRDQRPGGQAGGPDHSPEPGHGPRPGGGGVLSNGA